MAVSPQRRLAVVGNVVATKIPDATFLGMIRDVTELERTAKWLAGAALQRQLSQISQAIVWTPSRDELFRKVCRRRWSSRAGFDSRRSRRRPAHASAAACRGLGR